MSREGALWIGGLEPYMDEEFLMSAMRQSGEENIISIKVIKNKFTGQIAGYGFVNFTNDQVALKAMHRLNGKMIPNSRPPARYKLNHNSNRILPGEKNHSIWVGDLSPEVDDLQLFNFFSARFQTIISAKVVLDETGTSKGFGFIRFGNETEQQTALTTMQGIAGLGDRPIKVSIAVQKAKDPTQMPAGMDYPSGLTQTIQKQLTGQYQSGPGGDYNQYYNQYNHYWSNMAAWQQYNNYYQGGGGYGPNQGEQPPLPPTPSEGGPGSDPSQHQQQTNGHHQQRQSSEPQDVDIGDPDDIFSGPSNQPVEHSKPLDYNKLNSAYLHRSEEMYEAMFKSSWT